MDYDVLIIGGGVIGLSTAWKLSSLGMNTVLTEKHSSFGQETSSRNSEVIHAGIYYPSDSLKAKLCVPGNRRLYEWCKKRNVPHNRIGKYIAAVNNTELIDLERIYRQAKSNGAEGITEITASQINKEEPYIKAAGALWSPATGIVDSHSLMQSFEQSAIENGCDFAWKHEVKSLQHIGNSWEVEIADPDSENFSVNVQRVVNAAGLDADLIAEKAGIDIDKYNYRINFVRGHYFRIAHSKKYLANHLIYPVPEKNIRSLGIHITKELDGSLKLGPDVHYLDERMQDYSVPEELHDKFHTAASRYVRELEPEDIYPGQSGIRPKLQKEGGQFRDFIISEESGKGFPGLINMIGIESPGLTCCIEIAEMAAEFFE